MGFKARRRTSNSSTATGAPASSSVMSEAGQLELKLPTMPPENSPTAQALPSRATTKHGDSEKIAPILQRLRDAKVVAYDAETSGLDWRNNFICGHVLTFGPGPADSFYLPVRHCDGGNLCDWKIGTSAELQQWELHPIEDELIRLLDRQDLTVIGHHLNFDLRFLWRSGLRLRARYVDTIINAALIDEWQGRYSLEFCAEKAKVQAKKKEQINAHLCATFPIAAKDQKNAMAHFWRLNGKDPIGVEYAAGDGTTTWQLNDYQQKELDKQDLRRVYSIECGLIPVLARMSCFGIAIDELRFGKLRMELKQELSAMQAKLPANFNVRSPTDVKDWCEQNGHTDWPMTPPSRLHPEGQPSLAEAWLSTFEAGQQIVDIRKLMTLRDSFLMPLQVKHIWKGRVHTTFNQLRGDDFGTLTGRLSSSEPNLQQASKHDEKIGRMHRSIFVPDKGKIWGTADFSQIEPRLLAMYSNCRVLIDGYNADPPVDAHTSVAMACNKNWSSMTAAEQKYYRNAIAKRINQTLLTGGGKGVLVKKYKMDPQEVDRVWNDYFRTMPEIKSIQKRMDLAMRQRGYIVTLLGRRCRLNDPNKSYVALNRALQGGNADIMKQALVDIDAYLESEGRPVQMLNTVHDSIDFQFDEDHRKVYEHCLKLMCAAGRNLGIKMVPVVVDTGEGASWAEASFK